jgi:hypothetical protein
VTSGGSAPPLAATNLQLLFKAARPEQLTVKVPVDPSVLPSSKIFLPFFHPVEAKLPTVAGAPTFAALLTLTLLPGSSSVSEGVDASTGSSSSFSES